MAGPIARVAFVAAAAWLCAAAQAQTRVSVRAHATWDGTRALVVRDVAEVSGDDAERLGALVVRTNATTSATERVDAAAVRAALDAAGANWAKLELSGGTCEVTIVTDVGPENAASPVEESGSTGEPGVGIPAGAVTARDEAATDFAKGSEGKTAEAKAAGDRGQAREGRVRDMVQARMSELLGVGLDEMRVRFVSGDLDILDQRAGTGVAKRVVVEPRASAGSGRFPIEITIYDVAGERVERRGRVIADVSVIREVVVVTQRMAREDEFDAAALVRERRWVGTGEAAPAAWGRVVRSAARGALNAGHVVKESDLLAPVAVERGDIVRVHCLSGSVRVEAKARALSDGREGERIRLQLEGSKKSFEARLSGEREAVMIIEATEAEEAGGSPSASSTGSSARR